MGYILQVMPESPQPHRIEQAAKLLTKGQVAAVSTDTGFSLVCRLDDKEALDKIRLIRQLSEKKHFTLSVSDEQARSRQQYRLPHGKKRHAGAIHLHFGSD